MPRGRRRHGARTARVWDVTSGAELRRIAIPGDVEIGLSLPGDRFAWAEGSRLRIEAADGRASGPGLDSGSPIRAAEISPRGDRLLVITLDRRAIVWDVSTGVKVAVFPAAAAVFGQDGRMAASGALLRSVSLKVNYVGFEATGDCNFIAAMGDRHLATLIDAATGQPLNYIDSRPAEPVWITVDPAGRRVAAIDGDRVGIWDLELASEPPTRSRRRPAARSRTGWSGPNSSRQAPNHPTAWDSNRMCTVGDRLHTPVQGCTPSARRAVQGPPK